MGRVGHAPKTVDVGPERGRMGDGCLTSFRRWPRESGMQSPAPHPPALRQRPPTTTSTHPAHDAADVRSPATTSESPVRQPSVGTPGRVHTSQCSKQAWSAVSAMQTRRHGVRTRNVACLDKRAYIIQ
ncbi:hypothetical protein K466DRAFT_304212 [Polyporus arcularius HHB13444]|uniref:Uncharacterized protein n=1 Tax=Polyporus arcularius HHB13444 TaxID=1314778 RepID=A0A5C3NYM1_9APHY|nr:hypothetical protein K466DRAFT_304212 [Polyporus arcularius HHB13444]